MNGVLYNLVRLMCAFLYLTVMFYITRKSHWDENHFFQGDLG